MPAIDKYTGGKVVDSFGTGWGSNAFTSLALQGTSVAWASKADDEGAVYRGLSDGTGFITLATKQRQVAAVAVAGPWAYWARNNELLRKKTDAPKDAPPEVVGTRGLFTLVADGLEIYATGDDGTLVTTTANDDEPEVRVLAGGLLQPRGLAVDPWFVYTISTGASTVFAVHRRSARVVEVGKGGDPWDLAVTGASLWIVDRNWRVMTAVPKVAR